jgi:hypothetical protein
MTIIMIHICTGIHTGTEPEMAVIILDQFIIQMDPDVTIVTHQDLFDTHQDPVQDPDVVDLNIS